MFLDRVKLAANLARHPFDDRSLRSFFSEQLDRVVSELADSTIAELGEIERGPGVDADEQMIMVGNIPFRDDALTEAQARVWLKETAPDFFDLLSRTIEVAEGEAERAEVGYLAFGLGEMVRACWQAIETGLPVGIDSNFHAEAPAYAPRNAALIARAAMRAALGPVDLGPGSVRAAEALLEGLSAKSD